MTWNFATRSRNAAPSMIRDINRIVEQSGRIISLAAGMPSESTFPVASVAQACERILHRPNAASSLQYGATDGTAELREAVAESLPWPVDPGQVLITNGSQQGLDLVGRVLLDKGDRLLVERPTYPGALQAFGFGEPQIADVRSDAAGIDLEHLSALCATGATPKFLYVLPNFQNPTGRTMSAARRAEVARAALALGMPIVEDNPYGELWYDEPPPLPLASFAPENTVYLGTFSKVLAPGLRLGFAVAPKAMHRQMVMAKQAADLQPSTFAQRVVAEVIQGDFLKRHVASIRAQYKVQRDALLAALTREFGAAGDAAAATLQWNVPGGGMFIWAKLPAGRSASALLPIALDEGVAFIPGSTFYLRDGDDSTLRLSFVTATVPDIDLAVAALARAVRAMGNAAR